MSMKTMPHKKKSKTISFKEMEEIKPNGLKTVELFLEKLEKLNEKERAVLIQTIDLLNHPIFVSPSPLTL
jgi:hypothetical protein